jgi:hypothetical protein
MSKPVEPVEKVRSGLANTQIETYSEQEPPQTVLDLAQIDTFGTTITGIGEFFNRLVCFYVW